MNQGGYFGAYRQGFKTLPDNAYAMMTAPTQQNAQTIGMVAGKLGGAIQDYQTGQANQQALEQGAGVQFKGLEGLSQATGVPVNSELADQFKNMSSMSPQQQAQFNQSMGLEAQNMMTRYGISQTQARAAQAQGQMQRGVSNQDVLTKGLSAPFSSGGSSNAGGGAATNMSGSYMPYGSGGMDINNPLFRY